MFEILSSSCFILRKVFNHHKRCSTTKHSGSTDKIPFGNTCHLSSIRDKEKGMTWLQWEGKTSTLTDGWWGSYVFSKGFIEKFMMRGLPHKSLLCLLLLLFVLNFLPQPLQTNTWSLCRQTLCWLGAGKDLKALSQTLPRWNLFLSCALVPQIF